MAKKENELIYNNEKRLTKIEGFFGFLAVIITLSMTIAWDYIAHYSTSQAKYHNLLITGAISYYVVSVAILASISTFYLLRFLNHDKAAEKIAYSSLSGFGFALILLLTPIVDVIFSRNPQRDVIAGIFDAISIISAIILLIFAIFLMFQGVRASFISQPPDQSLSIDKGETKENY